MRYRVEIREDGEIKRYRGNYYIRNGTSEEVVSKQWMIKNIDRFSNLSISSNGNFYLIKDRFDAALGVIVNDFLKQMSKHDGLNVNEEIKLANTVCKNRGNSKIKRITRKSNTVDAWNNITFYDLNNLKILKACLGQAINYSKHQGKQPWLLTTPAGEKLVFEKRPHLEAKLSELGGEVTRL